MARYFIFPANGKFKCIAKKSINTAANFLTALFDGIILRIGLSIFFGLTLEMGYLGFWLGDALAGFTPLVIGAVLYFSGKWKV
ncbi:MAG: hypothetical protein IJT73_04725 [Selenomonadaceae bacterium]|nr:hypothetical protein [Selenomonadaceae bacterium]